jgi:hypothetical protein
MAASVRGRRGVSRTDRIFFSQVEQMAAPRTRQRSIDQKVLAFGLIPGRRAGAALALRVSTGTTVGIPVFQVQRDFQRVGRRMVLIIGAFQGVVEDVADCPS